MLKELNQVMDYIEARLEDSSLSLEEVATYAGVSDFHFRKVFQYLTGFTLSDYLKNRRLSEASNALLRGETVTEVAYQFGYQSLDGFTRAFKKWSGILPSEVVKTGNSKTFPKLTFIISVKGGIEMNFRIEEKTAFNLVGVTKRVPMQFEGVNQAIFELAKSITPEQRHLFHSLQNIEPKEIVNASYNSDTNFQEESGDLTHMIGVLTSDLVSDPSLTSLAIPACTWAVFPNDGPFPNKLQQTMASIYSEWLPSSDYELVDLPSFSFTKMKENPSGEAYSEIWLAVRKISKS